MPNKPAPALILCDGDEETLTAWTRSTTIPAGLALRARIILLAADGIANAHIAEQLSTTPTSVWKWRKRYLNAGLAGLGDAPRSGWPKQVSDLDIVNATLSRPPKKYGMTHWSSRLLADHLGLGNATVARAWRRYGVQRWWEETFTFSTGPELVDKVTDVVGLYLAPPDNAIVLCVDEKSQIQALDRTAPMLPKRIGDAEKHTHDDKHHGTTTLFAALEVATVTVTGAVKPKHRRQEFLSFLRQLDRAYPGQDLHLVMDNYSTHKTAEVKDWLAAHPRFHVPFTPTSGAWLNLVEVWFGIIDRQAIKRGVFTSVKDLNAKIRAFITGWTKRKHPFSWTKSADEILAKAHRQPTSETRH
ncbi:IS630 family transposase [Corynebacterium glyciniphilum]|uniref:IS630 family transposase n=1 Tax=Corynebacterium glyciniphilum TaxID=1404244 RepID=UPI0026545E45|nr:IS630 family transposase [Corynebacterium glyciniphilum]MDN6704600.1 IS630 family transposase [Corynebacterium glyciniphilum]